MIKAISLAFVLLTTGVYSQITINNSSMPAPSDTVRLSNALNIAMMDYETTGENYVWDFSTLVPATQRLDTFVDINSMPFSYQLVYNNPLQPDFMATVAGMIEDLPIPSLPNLNIENIYAFYKNASQSYTQLGYGGNINGADIPVKFDSPDIIYEFPIQYGNIDSCEVNFNINLPGLLYFEESKNRKNIVDGWGTITTPFGAFDVLRIKSIITAYDSVVYDTINFSLNRNVIEYKWMSQEYGVPILTVSDNGIVTSAFYIDSLRNLLPVRTDQVEKKENAYMEIYPNPSYADVNIQYFVPFEQEISIKIISLQTNATKYIVSESNHPAGTYRYGFAKNEMELAGGIYLLVYRLKNITLARKLIIN